MLQPVWRSQVPICHPDTNITPGWDQLYGTSAIRWTTEQAHDVLETTERLIIFIGGMDLPLQTPETKMKNVS